MFSLTTESANPRGEAKSLFRILLLTLVALLLWTAVPLTGAAMMLRRRQI